MKSRKIAFCGLLTALAIVLSLAERLFPLEAVVPVPGVKLGLANVVTLFLLTRFSVKESLAVLFCRVTISSVLMGSVTAFLFSLLGGLFSLAVMKLLLPLEKRACSLLGISVAGAAAHNIGQIIAALFWMQTAAVIAYLPFLLLMSIPLGLVTGLTCSVVLQHMRQIETHS